NGFRLSVFGFDHGFDHRSLVRDAGGRRMVRSAPEQSLLLQKATLQAPHAGGQRFRPGSPAYRKLARWIAEGARLDEDAPAPELTVDPLQATMAPGQQLQLRVLAREPDGSTRCVTAEAEYASNAGGVAEVEEAGRVRTGRQPGEAAILVRYRGQVGVCRIALPVPPARGAARAPYPASRNEIDALVWRQLRRLGLESSGRAEDAVFLRRLYLDTIGVLPAAEEARRFLAECRQESAGVGSSDGTRRRWIGAVLDRPEYAEYWAMLWSDLLRVDRDAVGPQGSVALVRWLRRQFGENRPYDEWVREIITAQGGVRAEGPAAFYRALQGPDTLSRSISQLFLGTRIECAQCHHHPSERWGQEDYWALAGFFTGVGLRGGPDGGESVYSRGGKDLPHPRTGALLPARALGAAAAPLDLEGDRREALATWMTAPDNPFFARAMANRIWAHYLGRGLVEPVDDLRVTNPASNPALLDLLAARLREYRYDLKRFTRFLLESSVYQQTGSIRPSNARDDQQFSRAYQKALPAEVMLDAICQVTGVPEKFNGWPAGYRAVQVWDNRMPSYFFRIFGRPVRASVCECERSTEPSIAQALHLMNSPEITGKIGASRGTARRLAEGDLPPAAVVEELFLAALARFPSAREQTHLAKVWAEAGSRREATEDILWSLLNTKEFLYNH
ncbi:MAG: DUF1553 domain-containing protein, partial [Armatimonadetes bacterium]|nr:DUF1553 domain-containing protein [Armatimonadota bacterium]